MVDIDGIDDCKEWSLLKMVVVVVGAGYVYQWF